MFYIYITSSYFFLLAFWFQPYRPHTAKLSTVLPFKDLSCQRESEAKEIIRKKAWIGSNVATVTSRQEGSIMNINVACNQELSSSEGVLCTV